MSEPNFKLLDHFTNPRNVGLIENADGFGSAKNPINGYQTDIYIKVEDGQIKDIKFKTFGCTVTIVAASALTEVVKGKSLTDLIDIDNPIENLMNLNEEILGPIPEKNWHCLPTAVQTLLIAVHDFFIKNKETEKAHLLEKLLDDVKNYFENYLNNLEDL